jgi:hypothetical protein
MASILVDRLSKLSKAAQHAGAAVPGAFRELDALVKAIGECKSKAEEDRIMLVEVETLKQRLSDPRLDRSRGREYAVRVLYCEMLGHDVSFALIPVLQLASDAHLLTKKVRRRGVDGAGARSQARAHAQARAAGSLGTLLGPIDTERERERQSRSRAQTRAGARPPARRRTLAHAPRPHNPPPKTTTNRPPTSRSRSCSTAATTSCCCSSTPSWATCARTTLWWLRAL